MRLHRVLIALIASFLFISLGEPIRMIEEVYANCCNPRFCGNWPTLLYGYIELQGNTAKVTIGKDSYSFEVYKDLLMEAEKNKTMAAGKNEPAYGFIILTGFGEDGQDKKLMVTAFIPANRKDHDKKISAQDAVNNYNKMYAEEFGLKKAYGIKK